MIRADTKRLVRTRFALRCGYCGVADSEVGADALKDSPHTRVSPATRERVRLVAAELGYYPNLFARRLVNRRSSNLIGLVSTIITGNNVRERQYNHVRYAFAATDYEIALVTAVHPERLADSLATFLRLQPAAILWGTEWQDPPNLEEGLTRYVESGGIVISFDDERTVPCDSVVFDEVEHTRLSMGHLLDLGHRLIGVGIDEWPYGVHAQGIFHALNDYGLNPDTAIRLYDTGNDSSFEVGVRVAETWLAQPDRPRAMCLWTDRQAAGFMRRVTDAGVRVPQDVSVIGHGDEEYCAYLVVPLTTVTRIENTIVEYALTLLHERLSGKYVGEARRIVVPSRLILRKSTQSA